MFEPVGPFSGGEKARLVLALVAYLRPNLLLLDEPTNHLDLEMRQALAVALQEYDGAVVLVSHDRHLLRTVADELSSCMRDARRRSTATSTTTRAGSSTRRKRRSWNRSRREASAEQKKQRKREEAERRNRLSPLRAEIARCEARLRNWSADASRSKRSSRARIYGEQAKEQLQELLKRRHNWAAICRRERRSMDRGDGAPRRGARLHTNDY